MRHPTLGSLGDPDRLSAVNGLALLDTPPEEPFDRLTRLAHTALGPKVAAICLLTDDRQFFKSAVGLPEPWATRRQIPLSHSLCRHVVESGREFTVKDTRAHPVTAASRAIGDLGAVTYAGVPLSHPDGPVVGTVCAWDEEPRSWTVAELQILRDLASTATAQLTVRDRVGSPLLERTGDGRLVLDPEWRPISINARAAALLRWRRAERTGGTIWESLPRLVGSRFHHELQRARAEGVSTGFVEFHPALDSWLEVQVHPEVDGALAVFLRDVGRREWAERELADRSRSPTLVAAVDAAVRGRGPLRQLFDRSMAALVRHADATLAQVWSIDSEGTDLCLESSAGIYTRLSVRGGHGPPRSRLIDRIVRTGRPHSTNRRREELRDLAWAEREDIVAFAGCPVVVDGETAAVVALFKRQPVTEAARDALVAVAERLGSAAAQRDRRAAAGDAGTTEPPAKAEPGREAASGPLLYGIAEAVLRHAAVDDLLPALARCIRPAFDADTVMVLLLDEASSHLHLRASAGAVGEVGHGAGAPVGVGVAGRVAERAKPVRIDDLATADAGSTLLGDRIRSVLAVPLVIEGDAIGVVIVGHGAPEQFTDGELKRLEVVAASMALAVDRVVRRERADRGREQAEDALRMHDEVLAIVSHDLRSPVSTILAAVELLSTSSQPTDGDAARPVELIRRAAARINRLLEDLLEVSRLESGHLSLTHEWFDVAPVVSAAREPAELQTTEQGIRIDTEVPDDVPALHADRDRILQALSNLVSNAVKFSDPGGHIHIRAEAREDAVCFSVADAGPGIPEEQLPHLFDRFWQAKRAHRADAGLGLTIVKEIVEAHGGRVWVESRLREGSTFYFTVPLGERS